MGGLRLRLSIFPAHQEKRIDVPPMNIPAPAAFLLKGLRQTTIDIIFPFFRFNRRAISQKVPACFRFAVYNERSFGFAP
jgi:hypothetical protein